MPSRGSPLRWARNSGTRVPSRELTITRSTSNAAGSTGASSARQTTLFGAAPSWTSKIEVGAKKPVNP